MNDKKIELKSKRKRSRTDHCRASARPQVRKLISQLRANWASIDRIERGERLQNLLGRGCSARGLARDTGIPESNIRRYVNLAQLPATEHARIRAGASAKKILTAKAEAKQFRETKERELMDSKTGEISDALADNIICFCRTIEGVPNVPIRESSLETFLLGGHGFLAPDGVRNGLWATQRNGVRFRRFKGKASLRRRFEVSCPMKEPDEEWIAHETRWLVHYLQMEEPSTNICVRAVEKAARRKAELKPTKGMLETYREKVAYLANIKYEPPAWRERARGKGARLLQRQGKH